MKLDLDILNKYVEDGWLMKQNHPTLPLDIYNYTLSTQYERHWDDVTIMCRGLVIESTTGKVIARCLPKFFNYEEKPLDTPWDSSTYVYVQKKYDGSYVQLFNYNGEWIVSSRGSFTSEMALKAMEIIKSKYDLNSFSIFYNHIGEVIYESNRICVDYGSLETVVFLTVTSPKYELGVNTSINYLKNIVGVNTRDIVETKEYKSFSSSLYKTLKEKNINNEEGYVLRFHPSNYRCKIKFEEYIRLHAILTNISSYNVWEYLMEYDKIPEDILKEVPDELYAWIHDLENKLRTKHKAIKEQIANDYHRLKVGCTKSSFADKIKKIENSGFLFSLYDIETYFNYILEKNYEYGTEVEMYNSIVRRLNRMDNAIWKLIKPKYGKPFNKNKEE